MSNPTKKETKDEIIEDLNKIKDLATLGKTPGGKQLVETLSIDIVGSLDRLVNERETLTLQGFVSIACDIKTRLDVVRSITRAKENKVFLEELLKETLQQ